MAKKTKNRNQTVRISYHLKQLTPAVTHLSLLLLLIIVNVGLKHYNPLIDKYTLKTSTSTLEGLRAKVLNLNNRKGSLVAEKNSLTENINFIKKKREEEGSLRFYTTNLPAYCRYVEFRASDTDVEIIDVNILTEENKVEYTVLGEYNNLVDLMTMLETREIYYIEDIEMFPSFSNKGSYLKYTANFNLEDSIVNRYEKKVKLGLNDEKVVDMEINDIAGEQVDTLPDHVNPLEVQEPQEVNETKVEQEVGEE